MQDVEGKILPSGTQVEINVKIPDLFFDVGKLLEPLIRSNNFPTFSQDHHRVAAFYQAMEDLQIKLGSKKIHFSNWFPEKVEEEWCSKDNLSFLVCKYPRELRMLYVDLEVKRFSKKSVHKNHVMFDFSSNKVMKLLK